MTEFAAVSARAPARRAAAARRGVPATTMLTVYLVLLIGFPSDLSIAALGVYGRPAFFWGLALLLWWTFSRLQRRDSADVIDQPVRLAFGAFLVIALVSFAVALLRGQPEDQLSTAVFGLLKLLSWAGVLLVALDGIRSMADALTMVRRIAIACALLALLGLVQFVTEHQIVDVLSVLPGIARSDASVGLVERGVFVRASGTAIHPLEFGLVIAVAVPVTIALAVHRFRSEDPPVPIRWWVALAALVLGALVAVSRSTLIGVGVAGLLMIPALPRRHRLAVVLGGVGVVGVLLFAVPHLFETLLGMFTGLGADSSAQSRQDGLRVAPAFIAASPIVGTGVGTLLPRYLIFDNQWLGTAIEMGLLGLIALAALFAMAIWSAATAGRGTGRDDIVMLGQALAATTATGGVLLIFFDAFAFPISGGIMFLLFGLCGALRTVGGAERARAA